MEKKLVVETNHLTKQYGSQKAVNNVSLHVQAGRIYGLLGRNGAGKTSIMKMILNLTSVTSGDIKVFGLKLDGNQNSIYPRIGSIIETPGFYPNLTGTENLQIFARLRGLVKKNAIQEALAVVGLPYNDRKAFSSYSLGMKQRLGIANAILNDPELLILDEPTNGLDPIGIVEIRDFLKDLSHNQGKSIIVSSHILSEIALMADDIGIIHNGKLIEECTMEELQQKNEEYISIKTDATSISKAVHILEKENNVADYSIEAEGVIRIYETTHNLADLNKSLVNSGVNIYSLQTNNKNLEDYFREITGGEGIA